MIMTQITVRYGAKRSANYQSSDVSGEITVSLLPEDKICDAFRGAMNKLTPIVNAAADAEIRVLCEDDRLMKGGH